MISSSRLAIRRPNKDCCGNQAGSSCADEHLRPIQPDPIIAIFDLYNLALYGFLVRLPHKNHQNKDGEYVFPEFEYKTRLCV
jgi:hypothetical protein